MSRAVVRWIQVTHVDAPGADLTSPLSAVLHRGKARVTLDLKTLEGKSTALELVKGADVVVSNFRPGVMERLGLGAKACQAVNPEVIYLTLPGYASTDKELANIKVGYDDVRRNARLKAPLPSSLPIHPTAPPPTRRPSRR